MADPKEALETLKSVDSIDGNGLMSRQFLMFMVAELSWKAWLFYAVYMGISDTVLMAAIAAAGAVESASSVARAWHDKHVKTGQQQALNGTVSAAVKTISDPTEG